MDAKGWYEGGGIGVLIKSWCYGWCYGCGDLGMVVGGGGMWGAVVAWVVVWVWSSGCNGLGVVVWACWYGCDGLGVVV